MACFAAAGFVTACFVTGGFAAFAAEGLRAGSGARAFVFAGMATAAGFAFFREGCGLGAAERFGAAGRLAAGLAGLTTRAFEREAGGFTRVGRADGADFLAAGFRTRTLRAGDFPDEAAFRLLFGTGRETRFTDLRDTGAVFFRLVIDFAAVLPDAALLFLPFGIGISALRELGFDYRSKGWRNIPTTCD